MSEMWNYFFVFFKPHLHGRKFWHGLDESGTRTKSQRKVSSARLIVYTAHFIRAGLDFQDRVPVLSVLGLPLDMVRARVKFWSGTDGPKSFTRLNLSVPNQFFWYAYFFHPSRAKNFRPCKWGFNLLLSHFWHFNTTVTVV